MDKKTNDKAPEPKQLHEIETDRQLRTIRFRPDGKLLFGAAYDALIRRWDFSGEEPQQLTPLAGHRGWVESLILSPQHQLLLSTDSWGQLCAWQYAKEPIEPKWKHEQAHDGWIRSLAISNDEHLLATAGRDKIVRVWSTADGKLLHELTGHAHEVYAVAIHPGGQSVVSGDLMGHVKHWDLAAGKCERELEIEKAHYYDRDQDVAGLYILQFHDEGNTLLCAGSDPTRAGRSFGVPTIRTVDWRSLEIQKTWSLGPDKDGFIFDLQRHPEGYWMLVTSGPPGAGKLMFLRPEEDEPFYTNTKMFNCHGLALQRETGRLVVAATNRRSQGNGAVLDKDGAYLGNSSPLHVFQLPTAEPVG